MHGPELIARAISEIRPYGAKGRRWQYNSRSDVHSSISCWAVMFDLLLDCALLREHIAAGKVGFGINHEMRDFQNNKEKCLDLVICRPHTQVADSGEYGVASGIRTFADLAESLDLPLAENERKDLADLPRLPIVPVGMVHIALEAKAAMTEFSKAKSRLFSELDSSISVINGHAQHAIAAALVMVNVASEFRSTIINRVGDFDNSAVVVSEHRRQPKPAQGIIETVRQLRRRSDDRERGFDAIGVILVDMKNDGSACRLITDDPPALPPSDSMHYDQMIARASALYAQRFKSV